MDSKALNLDSGLDVGPKLDLAGLPDLLGFHLRLAHVAMYRDFTTGGESP